MREILCVAIGGAIGATSRYKLSALVTRLALTSSFPLGTFFVNFLGCFLAGVIVGLGERFDCLTERVRLFLLTGILGGFTTFSAFSVESLSLIKQNQLLLSGGYVASSVCAGVLGVWLGLFLCRA